MRHVIRRTKITYRVMAEYDPGSIEPAFTTRDGKEYGPVDLSVMGAHPFSSGYPSEESARRELARAQAWVDSRGTGRAWIERITETTEIERLP
jgi:hypothetical protein